MKYLTDIGYQKFRAEFPNGCNSDLVSFMREHPEFMKDEPPCFGEFFFVSKPKPKFKDLGSRNGRLALRCAVGILQKNPNDTLKAFRSIEKYYKSRWICIEIISSALWFIDLTEKQGIELNIDEVHPQCVGGEPFRKAIYFGMRLQSENEI